MVALARYCSMPALEDNKDQVSVRAHDLSCISLTASSAVSKGRFRIAWLHDGLLCARKTALARLASSRQGREESRGHGKEDGNVSGAALRGAA